MIEGNYLSVLFWSSLIGIGLRQSSVATKDVIANLSTGITTVVQMIIGIAPIGILGLVFHSVATTGIGLAKYGQLLLLIGTMAVVFSRLSSDCFGIFGKIRTLLLIPLACSLFGISNDIAMQVVGVGFIVGVVQDSIETALNSSSDLLFTTSVELADRRKMVKVLMLKR